MSYLDILVKKNIIETGQEKTLKKKASLSKQVLDYILLSQGVSQEEINKAKEEFFNLPVKKLKRAGAHTGVPV